MSCCSRACVYSIGVQQSESQQYYVKDTMFDPDVSAQHSVHGGARRWRCAVGRCRLLAVYS
jgi:hypothetical protein